MEYVSSSLRETKELANELAQTISKSGIQRRHATVIGLVGDLGAGKTSFIQGFLRALGVRGKVSSPTFVLMKRHIVRRSRIRFKNAYHIDAYRFDSKKELASLGFKEIEQNTENIILVEWADRIKKNMPRHTIWIMFEHLKGDKRRIKISEKQ